jgi:hypothetical protein
MNFIHPLILCAAIASPGPRKTVLLVVPAGASVSEIQRARSAVPSSWSAVLAGAGDRIAVREGVSILADQTFATAGPADAVVVLGGSMGEDLLDFLGNRRSSARIIVFLQDSPAVDRLRRRPGGDALIVTGSVDSLPALLASTAEPKQEPAPSKAAPPRSVAPVSPALSGSVFDRYFSAASSASHRPNPSKPN